MSDPNHRVEWILIPPPGMRFVNQVNSDCHLQFSPGQERECLNYFKALIEFHFEPATLRAEAARAAVTVPPPVAIPENTDDTQQLPLITVDNQ